MTLTFGSLFAGVGGMDLGLERSGMRCVWQVENDDHASRVLAKHWPDVRRHDDVRTFPPTSPDDWRCDVIAGGFPCQDISNAGKRAGITGERSGLWKEFARIVRVVRPRFVIVENVAALLGRGMGVVLGDLAALGIDAEWDVYAACDFGAPHIRERVFIVADDRSKRWFPMPAETVIACQILSSEKGQCPRSEDFGGRTGRSGKHIPDASICRMDDGLPSELDARRIRACGNAVVPQMAEFIGRKLLTSLEAA